MKIKEFIEILKNDLDIIIPKEDNHNFNRNSIIGIIKNQLMIRANEKKEIIRCYKCDKILDKEEIEVWQGVNKCVWCEDCNEEHEASYQMDKKRFIIKLKQLLVNGDYYGDKSFTSLFKNIDKLAEEWGNDE